MGPIALSKVACIWIMMWRVAKTNAGRRYASECIRREVARDNPEWWPTVDA